MVTLTRVVKARKWPSKLPKFGRRTQAPISSYSQAHGQTALTRRARIGETRIEISANALEKSGIPWATGH
jgi:hypothetical protein